MVTLRRNIRVKDTILLPNGERVKVEFDVQAHLRQVICAQDDTIQAAQAWKTDETSEEARSAFYTAFGNLLHLILGPWGFDTALKAYDGHVDELCGQLDEWVLDEVAPRIRAASQDEMERRKRLAKRMRRYAAGK
jgi:hypothetical protein